MEESDEGEWNSTSWLESEPGEIYEVPTGVVVVLSVFYGSISLVAVVGNVVVIWIVTVSRRMHNVTSYFIANLASADIIIGLFSIPFQFQAALLQRWNLPHFMCAFCPFVQVLSVNVSVFTLTAIALDRYRAILHPLSARPSKMKAKMAVAAIWIVSASLATPMAVALRVSMVAQTRTRPPKPFCHNVGLTPEAMRVYTHVLVALQYFTPLMLIVVVYVRMGRRLWGARAPGNAEDQRDATLLRNKKKVIKMLVIVVALFAVCWLPLQMYNFLQEIYPQINHYRYINIIWFCSHWLAMSNSCYNPFIYAIYNEKFQRELRARLRCFFRERSSSPTTEVSEMDKMGRINSIRFHDLHTTNTRSRSLRHAANYSTRKTSRSPSIKGKSYGGVQNGCKDVWSPSQSSRPTFL